MRPSIYCYRVSRFAIRWGLSCRSRRPDPSLPWWWHVMHAVRYLSGGAGVNPSADKEAQFRVWLSFVGWDVAWCVPGYFLIRYADRRGGLRWARRLGMRRAIRQARACRGFGD